MKIGYDAKRAFYNNTGLGNYSRWFIKLMATCYPGNQYYLCTPKTKNSPFIGYVKQQPNLHILTAAKRALKWLWRSKGVLKHLQKNGVTLYHGLSHELPFSINHSNIKSIVTVHDAIVLRYPGQFGHINAAIYTYKLKHACKVANHIVAISQKTADDLIELLNINPNKISVVYQDADDIFKQPDDLHNNTHVRATYNLPGQYLLSVGTVEERKNLLLTVQALKLVPHIPLVIIGRQTKYTGLVTKYAGEHGLTNRLVFLENVSFNHLPAIYRQAAMLIYPSRYEGFGLPVLEALYSGTPVIAATGSCLEEAGGPHSLYINPDDADTLARYINTLLNDENLRQKMIAQGKKYTANFDGEKLAAQMLQLYQNTLQNA